MKIAKSCYEGEVTWPGHFIFHSLPIDAIPTVQSIFSFWYVIYLDTRAFTRLDLNASQEGSMNFECKFESKYKLFLVIFFFLDSYFSFSF